MHSCIDCGYLDKTRAKESIFSHYNYGCNARVNGYTCGWISKDSELKNQGCSDWIEINTNKQISIFDV